MPRYDFGGTTADFVFSTQHVLGRASVVTEPAVITFWTAETGGTRHTDLRLGDATVSSITTDGQGKIPRFQGPDGVVAMWADTGSGPRLLTQLAPGQAVLLADEARAAAEAAAATAAAIALGEAEAALSEQMGDPETLIGATLNAAIVDLAGTNLGRFIERARAGRPVKIVGIGDSILAAVPGVNSGGAMGVDDTISRTATLVAARFGTTVTTANHALSGHTAASGPLSGKWNAAIAENPDLFVIDYGTNDWSAEEHPTPVPGYRTAASLGALERLFRRIRAEVPKADIVFLIANPYTSADTASNNVGKKAYNKAVRDVCASYGVEVVDGYRAFMEHPNRASLMYDSTHPNAAGHHVLADEILKHLPAAFQGQTRSLAAPPTRGLAKVEYVDPTFGDTGVQAVLVPTAQTWVESGTGWGAGGAGERLTSTAGDKITTTVNAVELYAMLSTTAADAARVTVKVDGADVWTNIDLTLGKQGMYWVPLITSVQDLAPGSHVFEIVLVSGSLRVSRIGWLRGASGSPGAPTYNDDVVFQELGSGTTLTTVAGTAVKIVDATVTLPSGWSTADVELFGYVNHRITAATTTVRRFNVVARLNGVVLNTLDFTVAPVTENTYTPPATLSGAVGTINATRPVSLESRILSTDTTLCGASGWKLVAKLTRRT